MENVKKLKELIFPKLTELGFDPICCYYGGSFLNGTYDPERSDLDVIVVINGENAYCSTFMRVAVKNLEYSLLFDCLWEYEGKKTLREAPTPRLYGYLNSLDLAYSDIAVSKPNQRKVDEIILPHLKDNAKMAAKELILRDLNVHLWRKEDYHLLRAINILEECKNKISFNDIIACKKGKISLESVLAKRGFYAK